MKSLILAVALVFSAAAYANTAATSGKSSPASGKTGKPAVSTPAKPEVVDTSIEPVVRGLIPEGYVSEKPVVSRLGRLERRSYVIHKQGAPDAHGFYPAPLILVETIDGKVSVHEKVGPAWGWTGVRKGRSAGLGDPHHDIELREFDNGRESRILAFFDGRRLQVNRGGKPEVLTVKPSRTYEIQLATIGARHALIEISGKTTTVFTLNGETFSPDAELTKVAQTRGIGALPELSVKWTSAKADLK